MNDEKFVDTLHNCPFCGGRPKVKYIGNEFTRTRKILVQCTSCRCQRTDGSPYHDFEWIEDVARRNWNQRP